MVGDISAKLKEIIKNQYEIDTDPVFVRTDETHGDFASNIAMQLAGKLQSSPTDIAGTLSSKLAELDEIDQAIVAGPGFINIRLNDGVLINFLGHASEPRRLDGQRILLEYSCPNAFKEFHTGHLYQTLIGDSMGRIYENQGAQVYRTSFGGDVGLHAGKCMWGVLQALGGEDPGKLSEVEDRPAWISAAYVNGSKAYEDNDNAKAKIEQLNKRIYQLFADNDNESPLAQISSTVRRWSYDYFEKFYESIGAVKFDKYYPESQTMSPGLNIVNAHIGQVFSHSESAVVLDEAKSGLHTRVFITSEGLPTYETKDLGVIKLEAEEFPYDQRTILTGNDQSQYMQVIFKALSLIDEQLGAKQKHVANGTVRFGDGQKMSSRLGNVSRAIDVVDVVTQLIPSDNEELKTDIGLGAIKYSLLKSKVGADIAFDIEQSISTEGNSGPYLQYALVRARSIARKSDQEPKILDDLTTDERKLAFKLTEKSEVLKLAIDDFSPHHICTYIYELASEFNRFYENNRVIGDDREAHRLYLINKYEATLAECLGLLGIPTPESI